MVKFDEQKQIDSVNGALALRPQIEELIDRLVKFSGLPQELKLPSAPKQFLHYFTEDDRPQPKLDRNLENGMDTDEYAENLKKKLEVIDSDKDEMIILAVSLPLR